MNETLGDRLAKAMKRAGVKNPAVAEAVGVHHTTVSRWRGDAQVPDEPQLQRLAEFLQVDAAWLRYGDQAPTSTRRAVDAVQPATRGLSRELMAMRKGFELETYELGADDADLAHIRNILNSAEETLLYAGGHRDQPLSAPEQRQQLESTFEMIRHWLRERIRRREEAARRPAPRARQRS